jgi:hypothetical protein
MKNVGASSSSVGASIDLLELMEVMTVESLLWKYLGGIEVVKIPKYIIQYL